MTGAKQQDWANLETGPVCFSRRTAKHHPQVDPSHRLKPQKHVGGTRSVAIVVIVSDRTDDQCVAADRNWRAEVVPRSTIGSD